MNKMKEEKKIRPPYTSTGHAEEILDLFRRITPKKIDSKFIVENNIATAPNASTVFNFARWMGIVNDEGDVDSDVASKLRLVGDERDIFIKELIEKAYKDILEGINLNEARRDDVTNFFIHNYKFGPTPAKSAAILFLHLSQRYGIPISDELKKKTHIGGTPKIRKEKKLLEKKQKFLNQDDLKILPPKEGVFVLSIRGNGLNKEVLAHNKEELQKVYEGKFKSFIEAAKHLFLEEDEKKESDEEGPKTDQE